jgi:hypothetical protein
MKRLAIIVSLLLVGIFILTAPATSLAEHKKWDGYLSFKGGAYFPTGDLQDDDIADYESGFNGEIVVGMYTSPNLALEFGGGYFRTTAPRGAAGDDKIWVIPVVAKIKGVLPLKSVELFAGGGFGLYFANIDVAGAAPTTGSDKDTVFGGQVLTGLNINLSERVFISVEGNYIFTAKAELYDDRVNLDGFTVTGALAFMF